MPRYPVSSRWKLPKSSTPFVSAFYMAGIMAFLMCMVIVAANGGLRPDFIGRVLKAYALAMPVAFVCVLIVRPLVARLVMASVRAE
ncbi:hypothetical protein HNP55_000628 [Paucibacter oligotrophus]|uniref:DUF2798 domain-containing protein n=1 Tax=Roseateles oligotrophus TaxID=1769250 RepID=A0A840L5M6_9BURK|nr:DUF2798 domain-containing protein [Roseateles oligotrophus]MBB4842133.1 hypothetical protein [Roseateles oligotrophus]